ncbi:MAG: hypothetical protein JJU12_08075 [Chlamydiales bacterium]|nr:hypothetical protein [Chlamydiales bacterium]
MTLIIAKDPEERRRVLQSALNKESAPIFSFPAEEFEPFLQEVETLPFLSKSKAVVLQEVDLLDKRQLKKLEAYVEKANPWVTLYLTAASPPAQSFVKKCDSVVCIKDEKPWEKDKRLVEWVVGEAAAAGVALSAEPARVFVKAVDSQFLKQELEKLICYVGERREITVAAIHEICTPIHHETLWQLGDAIFARQTSLALQIGSALLDNGMALFSLLAHLRTQLHMTLKVLTLYRQEGKMAVSKAFPYLKGGLLDKKIITANSYGLERIRQGLVHLFETELQAKNSAIDHALLLEILLVKISHDSISTPKRAWSC